MDGLKTVKSSRLGRGKVSVIKELISTSFSYKLPDKYKREYITEVRIANANRLFLCCLFVACSKSVVLIARVIRALSSDGYVLLFNSDNMLTVVKIILQLVFAVGFGY